MLKFVIITLLVHYSIALGLYDDIDDYDLWPRGGPSTPGGKSDCKKDILVLWDNSQSVGPKYFREYVRPFLINLIKSPQLNVGPDGTHIGFITFATQPKTRILLDVGEKTGVDELTQWLNSLDYNKDLLGDGTRTGYAFKIADEDVFRQRSPRNHRADVDDVILLFTDGEPVWRVHRNHKPKPEDKFNFKSEKAMAEHYSTSLKGKGVTIVGLAVGTDSQLRRFYDDIMRWSSPNLIFKTDLRTLSTVENKLVKASCIGPGACSCDTVSTEAYIPPGQSEVEVSWVEPAFKCERKPVGLRKTVNPNVNSPATFSQDTTIAYEYSFRIGNTRSTKKCFVEISVGACKCSSALQIKEATLGPRASKAYVSWTEPTVSCPVKAHQSNPSSSSGKYSVGRHTEIYKFTHTSEKQSFDVNCRVNIFVKGLCGGKGYNARQVCCCGKIYPRKSGFKCCGMKYYNSNNATCCDKDRANLVPRGKNCF